MEQIKRFSESATVKVFSTKFNGVKDFLSIDKLGGVSCKTYRIDKPKNFLSYLKFIYLKLPKLHRKIAEEINKARFDVIIVTHDYWTKSPYLLRYLHRDTPSIYWCHEYPREFYEPINWHVWGLRGRIAHFFRLPIKRVDQINVSHARSIVTISNYMKARLKNIYNREVFVVRNGVDVDFFQNKCRRRERLLLSVGALNKLKGHDFIIRALGRTSYTKHFKLLLVGNGGRDTSLFREIAKRLGVRLEIREFVPDEELVEIYNRAFLLLYAPRHEPFGLVPLEAMACGLPVLGVKEGGVEESVKKDVGWLVDRSIDKFSRQLDWLLRHRDEVEQRRKIVRDYVTQHWSWDDAARHFLAILSRVIRENKA